MGKTVLVLIRHGETELNIGNVFRGRLDIGLTDNGRAQAAQLAEALRSFPLVAVYSSPLRRAMVTARTVAAVHDLAVQPDQDFQNICLGEWEGTPKQTVKARFPELWRQWVTTPETVQIPGAETLAQMRIRIRRGLDRLLQGHPGRMIAVVTHRSVLKVALAIVLGLEKDFFWKFYLDNCSYSLVEHQSALGYTITRLNENGHLENPTIETF
ncbi:MAG: histidine phosphatase family protein [Acidobacteria bacterium]|nr:histidine phosphatase family protein [Acidobacteriota bacterium]